MAETTPTEHIEHPEHHLELAPAVLVIFGVTGDLATRKLLPALYELEKNDLLHPKTQIVGIPLEELNVATAVETLHASVERQDGAVDEKSLARFAERLSLYAMNATAPEPYTGLKELLDDIEETVGLCMNRLYYLALPPEIIKSVITHLGEQGLNRGCDTHGTLAQLLLEKPFGYDTRSAQDLIDTTRAYFEEKQIFRIDHYLAKETVQNIATFRFHNPLFENVWSSEHIKSIEIVADEELDIEGRAQFYEQTGALRDLVQSHLLHVLSVVMMDRPASMTKSDDMHTMRQRVLEDIEPVAKDALGSHAVRGQYDGYRDEVSNGESKTETFVALKLFSRDQSWHGVPLYIRTGKALARKETRIVVTFQSKKHEHEYTNALYFSIHPTEGISIRLWAKEPGFDDALEQVPMTFGYNQVFDSNGHPNAYERVLVDAIRGDNTLFATSEEVMASWKILQGVLDAWAHDDVDLLPYAKGSEGPDVQDVLT